MQGFIRTPQWAVWLGVILAVSSVGLAQPPLGAQAVRGVNYAHLHRGGRGYGSDASRRELANLRALGVDWVALTPFGYQPTHDDDRVRGFNPDTPIEAFLEPQPKGPANANVQASREGSLTDRHLADQVVAAHGLGIKVLIKPHIWSGDFWRGDQWHGTIDQVDDRAHERWRRSYLRFILHYARLARDTQADALCIGTELVQQTLKHPDDWRTLILEVRKVYPGPITYAAHWESEYQQVPFWDELDAIGISAYFPLNVPDDASVQQLVNAWEIHKNQIAQLQQRFGKPVVFLELGYRPATGAYREPWLTSGGAYDPMIQTRAYEAVFRTFADEPWWRGVFLWKAFTDADRPDHHGRGPGFSFRNQPAERVVQKWFGPPQKLEGK